METRGGKYNKLYVFTEQGVAKVYEIYFDRQIYDAYSKILRKIIC